MNKQEIFNKIYYAAAVLWEKKINEDDRIKIGEDAIELYERISVNDKQNNIKNIYIVYRELGRIYSANNMLQKSEEYFEKSLFIKNKNSNIDMDSFYNECITKQILSRVKLLLYLISNDYKKLNQAKEYLDFLEENYDERFDNEFKEKTQEYLEMYDKILKKDIKSIVTFKIPYHLLIGNNEEIEFSYKGIECSIKSQTIRDVESGFIQGDNIYSEKDKYGIINNSIITLKIGKYINIWDFIEVNKSIGKVRIPLKEAIDVYNYFLKKYIVATNKYWLPEINENMIVNNQIIVYAGDIEIHNVPLSMNLTISSTGYNELKLKESEIIDIKEELISEEIENWKLALNNAKDYYFIKDYKNAIIMINIALENFTYVFAKEKLKAYKTKEEIDNFMNGRVVYEDYFLKEYISEENFNKAKNKNIIKDNPPTIFKIFKECLKYFEMPLSKNQINNKINIIKDQRNEIVHGVKITKDLRYVAENAIEEFEKFVSLLQ